MFFAIAHTTDVLEVFKVHKQKLKWVCMMEDVRHKGVIEALSCGGGYCVTGIRGRGMESSYVCVI